MTPPLDLTALQAAVDDLDAAQKADAEASAPPAADTLQPVVDAITAHAKAITANIRGEAPPAGALPPPPPAAPAGTLPPPPPPASAMGADPPPRPGSVG